MNSGAIAKKSGWNALSWWAISFVAANLASSLVISVSGHVGDLAISIPIWVTLVGAIVLWCVQIALFPYKVNPSVLQIPHHWRKVVSVSDVGRFVSLGIFGQLILVNVVNWPLSQLWPDTFSFEEVSQRAQDVTSTAPGAWVIALVVVVVIGAPIVEEILYRGTLQPALEREIGSAGSLVFVAALFALIHFQPVEIPGLFAFALLLGAVRLRTGRLAPAIITHLAFNATGLVLVSLT